jgi:hypothetical protein
MPLLNDTSSSTNAGDFALRWYKVRNRIKDEYGARPDVNVMLFLIGLNEVGIIKDTWEKEEKLDLIHVAVCRLLASEGYYRLDGTDEEGWPHYEATKGLPTLSMKEQEDLLKIKIVEYFEQL